MSQISFARSLQLSMSSTGTPSEAEVLAEEHFSTRIVSLNRPRKLNALTPAMVQRLTELYEGWEKNPLVRLVVIKGIGRGFCAGGDIAGIYHMNSAGRILETMAFYRKEYMLNYLVGTYKKPQVAILNGVVMGAGTGISIHGRFRVATENSLFAMPEAGIGLHPDVGASYYLSRLPGHIGEYLGLTGTRLDGADMLAMKLATHFVPSSRLQMLEECLSVLNTDDTNVLSNTIEDYSECVGLNEKSPLHRKSEIDSCFGKGSMEEIVRALKVGINSGNPWYQETLGALRKASPLSLKLTLRSMREGRTQRLHQCLEREFRLSAHAIEGRFTNDFTEGCRAAVVRRDNPPKWKPPSLEEVSSELVDYYFSPLDADVVEELQLPVEEREARSKSTGYARL